MASALVQMTAFSPCTQLGDVVMIGTEASLESFPGSREDGNKRSHSDIDEEHDRSHVKKRRKQSKPIRITATDSVSNSKGDGGNDQRISQLDFSDTGEHFLTEGLVRVNSSLPMTENYEEYSHMNQEQKKIPKDNQNKKEHCEIMYDSLRPLNLSSIKTQFMDSLVIPNVNESQIVTNEHASTESQVNFQYNSQESSKPSVVQESSYLSQSPSLLLPLFKQNQIQNHISHIRIFNPEAFCDLCNKEFCNKYFLKTHKANKHGIYTENQNGPTLLDPLPSLPFTNYFSTNETYENPSVFQTKNVSKNIFSQASYSANRTVPKKNLPPQNQSSLFSLKTNSTGNMRALCNICQREFCNKYFVRRHKLKIHGIIEPVSKENSIADTQESNSLNNNTSQDKIDLPTSEVETVYSGYTKQFVTSSFTIDIKETPHTEHSAEHTVEKVKEIHEKESESDIKVPLASHNVFTSSEGIALFQGPNTEENNKENSLSSSKLKKLGVVNADAFCNICCKEYCNKYFLRTHKLKTHGILPVEEKKDDNFNESNSNMFWIQNQTAPLNLIVNEGPVNKDYSEKNGFDTEEESVCSVCGRYFQSLFLLKMHLAYTHQDKYITNEAPLSTNQNNKQYDATSSKDINDSEKVQKIFLENQLPVVKSEYLKESDESENKLVVNTENLQKLQTLISRLNHSNTVESSTCDVCEKDVGHVSLLENHILKDHAMLLEEIGNFTEEDNSSSQSSLVLTTYTFKKECPRCQKMFFKPSMLEQHMNEVHNELLEFPIDPETQKEALDLKDLNNSLKTSPIQFITQPSEDRQGLQTPTSSFCEICKKELCNKYFMKTHMQRMHGISIENGAQIGGVICDICNKELCSKYFLRVHKQNSHGIVDELFLPQLGVDFFRNQSPNADHALKPTDQTDLNHRYFTHFNEVCTICSRRFRSVKWLKAHLWNDHGEEGKERWKEVFQLSNSESKINQLEDNMKDIVKPIEFPVMFGNSSNQISSILNQSEVNQNLKDSSDKQGTSDKNLLNNTTFSMLMNGKDSETKQYQCSYCSFTTTILAFLFIHERSHMNTRSFPSEPDQPMQCPICYQNMDSKENFEKHFKLHKMSSWQHPYCLNNSSQDLSKEKMCEEKSDFNPFKERVTQQEQNIAENVNVPSNHDTKSKLIISMQSSKSDQTTETSVKCTRCGFSTSNIDVYLDHLNKEHPFLQMDQELPSYLQQVERALSNLAYNTGIPAVFAVPRIQDQITMQPFVLEDSDYNSDINNSIDPKPGKTFLSSLVFLPVKEKLKKSVTASFKLTPT